MTNSKTIQNLLSSYGYWISENISESEEANQFFFMLHSKNKREIRIFATSDEKFGTDWAYIWLHHLCFYNYKGEEFEEILDFLREELVEKIREIGN